MTQKDIRKQQLIDWLNTFTPFTVESLDVVSGDASFRRYFRFHSQGRDYIAVDAPPTTEDTRLFVDVADTYRRSGIRVPEVFYVDDTSGFYCLEDFGNTLFADALKSGNPSDLYRRAIDMLPAIQQCRRTARGALPVYDADMVKTELSIFSEWLLAAHLRLSLSAAEKTMLDEAFESLANNFLSQPQVGVHRDFHSRNLMLLPDNGLGVIDFQGTVTGPVTYDAVSLLRDCYLQVPDELVNELVTKLHGDLAPASDPEQFTRWFDLTGIQRHLKASGIFARLLHRDDKTGYIKDIPLTLSYIAIVGKRYEETSALAEFVESRVIPGVAK